jgi:hypothetical protein
MELIKNDDKSILLIPETAAEEYFIWYLTHLVEAKEKETLREISLLRQKPLSQDHSPS